MKIVTSDQMRQIEQDCGGIGLATDVLMENAGKTVADAVSRVLGPKEKHILCLIGPGNNGGDGLVAARYLRDQGAAVTVYLCSQRPSADHNLQLVREHRIPIIELTNDNDLEKLNSLLPTVTCVIDAIFGTGKIRPFSGVLREALDAIAAEKTRNNALRIVAIDLPSGLNADTGEIDPASLFADDTITLAFPKPGLFTFPGAERVGRLTVADIGIPAGMADSIKMELITPEWARSVLPKRPLNANKGSFGKVLVVAGSVNYIGAAFLACSGAMRSGAGLITLATPASLHPILASKMIEATYLPLPESAPGVVSSKAAAVITGQFSGYDALVIGCGLGQSTGARELTGSVLFSKGLPHAIIDADGLNALSQTPDWWQELGQDAILTPHPGEMARLTGLTIDEIQQDRVGAAQRSAEKWHKTIVLKGAYTVIAAPDGRCRICPIANAGLASAGTGDVLSGVIGGLVGQGLSLFDAATLGVYLHALAGEAIKAELGDTGAIASDLLPLVPKVIKQLKEGGQINAISG